MQGASATERILEQFATQPVRVLVVWEPVLITDWGPPSTASLARIHDGRAAQFWDKRRLISHVMGERDRHSIVWDHIGVYPAGAVWGEGPPPALYEGGTGVRVIGEAQRALAQALEEAQLARQREHQAQGSSAVVLK